jgi:hypothetical protein
MKEVILNGGGKTILDINHCMFFYVQSKKDLEYIEFTSDKKKIDNSEFPLMYIFLSSSKSKDNLELLFPMPKKLINMDKVLEDYKKKKISAEVHEEILNVFLKTFITNNLKDGIFRNSDFKINLLKGTELAFVNAVASTDKEKKKFFSKLK